MSAGGPASPVLPARPGSLPRPPPRRRSTATSTRSSTVVAPLPELDLTLLDAHGCVLAEDVVATAPLPNFDNSAMDGYAVRAADVAVGQRCDAGRAAGGR